MILSRLNHPDRPLGRLFGKKCTFDYNILHSEFYMKIVKYFFAFCSVVLGLVACGEEPSSTEISAVALFGSSEDDEKSSSFDEFIKYSSDNDGEACKFTSVLLCV